MFLLIENIEFCESESVHKTNFEPRLPFRVQFPQFHNTQIINLTFWGNLATDVAKYYQISDYILIEGSLSLKNKDNLNRLNRNIKTIEITVLKIYPFLLSQTSRINNI